LSLLIWSKYPYLKCLVIQQKFLVPILLGFGEIKATQR
jgi:hypothetical protein